MAKEALYACVTFWEKAAEHVLINLLGGTKLLVCGITASAVAGTSWQRRMLLSRVPGLCAGRSGADSRSG